MHISSDSVKLLATGVLGFALGAAVFGVVGPIFAWGSEQKLIIADDDDSDYETDSENESGSAGNSSLADVFTEHKMILVVRTDLQMTKGKAAAQCCHATLGCYKKAIKHFPTVVKIWERSGQPKITVQAKGEDSLLIMQAQAQSLGITHCLVRDAGRTQIAAGSATVLGLGPAPKHKLDQITGDLKLY
ncbi:peptidyl-tRNA hydrolase PTH2-domain-containing protein [Lipomyces kononenkoae]|uniref:Peptidyl-tRNA hydrolase PTH2-domain-containing protein n=1 Tax=Lipomyces kononenkoae TaxID=34357 RepID=A0ACC3SRE2_LIPKO